MWPERSREEKERTMPVRRTITVLAIALGVATLGAATTHAFRCGGKAATYTPYAYPHPLAVQGPRPKPPTLQQ